MNRASRHALIVPLYGELKHDCLKRLEGWTNDGFIVIAVNNNPHGSSLTGVVASSVVHNHNRSGLAGGLNVGVSLAIKGGAEYITLLDQDSVISSSSLLHLSRACAPGLVVGPHIIDDDRHIDHTPFSKRVRILISSGTTFVPSTWQHIGPLRGWMEIDYIDHEWCSRARRCGVKLTVVHHTFLFQTFGTRHPNHFIHLLGLQLYSPYRRAIAIRNLRWLLFHGSVPFDIRIKELIKMLIKPCIWLIFEPNRRTSLIVTWIGLTAPLERPFPRERLNLFS